MIRVLDSQCVCYSQLHQKNRNRTWRADRNRMAKVDRNRMSRVDRVNACDCPAGNGVTTADLPRSDGPVSDRTPHCSNISTSETPLTTDRIHTTDLEDSSVKCGHIGSETDCFETNNSYRLMGMLLDRLFFLVYLVLIIVSLACLFPRPA